VVVLEDRLVVVANSKLGPRGDLEGVVLPAVVDVVDEATDAESSSSFIIGGRLSTSALFSSSVSVGGIIWKYEKRRLTFSL